MRKLAPRYALWFMAAWMIAAGLPACDSSSPPGSPGPAAPSSPTAQTYTVRGQVTMVPMPNDPASQLRIHHEAIADFKDQSGKEGMSAMDMPFTPAKGLSLANVKSGDKVEFVLSVDWPQNRIEITRIKVLPADTALKLSGNMGDGHEGQDHDHAPN